jgi:Icc-related predicted phosphoesterase
MTPLRLLLVTDTHGHLDQINVLAATTGADAVVHAGDFGFYGEDSTASLSDRELALRIVHSPLEPDLRKKAFDFSREEKVALIRERCPLSDLPQYLREEKRFNVPVYAVWGNHEDKTVVEAFLRGDCRVENLHLLNEKHAYHVDPFHVAGLGGNFLVGDRLFQKPLAGGGGKIWSTLTQYLELLDTVRATSREGDIRVLVSHVSSGKEPFISAIGAHCRADFIVSGHMGPPVSMTWNDFAISEVEEAEARLKRRIEDVSRAWSQTTPHSEHDAARERIERGLARIAHLPEDRVRAGRGAMVPWWYMNMTQVNLPDAEMGYAVLAADADGRLSLDTSGTMWMRRTGRVPKVGGN